MNTITKIILQKYSKKVSVPCILGCRCYIGISKIQHRSFPCMPIVAHYIQKYYISSKNFHILWSLNISLKNEIMIQSFITNH